MLRAPAAISREQLDMVFSNNRQLLDSLLRGSTVGYHSDSWLLVQDLTDR